MILITVVPSPIVNLSSMSQPGFLVLPASDGCAKSYGQDASTTLIAFTLIFLSVVSLSLPLKPDRLLMIISI